MESNGLIWFTADLHLGHENIIRYCKRPFSCAAEMDDYIIRAWRELVSSQDSVFVLGDFSFHSPRRTSDILDELPGKKYLIKGNHDRRVKEIHGWTWVESYCERVIDGHRVVMSHYPIEQWRAMGTGSFHVHGHRHGPQTSDMRRLDVGVDLWGFQPISWGQVKNEMLRRPWDLMSRDE